jgi:hypothetical protein
MFLQRVRRQWAWFIESVNQSPGTPSMTDLELATTEQILEELGRRPLRFVHVCTFMKGDDPSDGLIAYSPNLDTEDAAWMLRRAQKLLEEPEDGQLC